MRYIRLIRNILNKLRGRRLNFSNNNPESFKQYTTCDYLNTAALPTLIQDPDGQYFVKPLLFPSLTLYTKLIL